MEQGRQKKLLVAAVPALVLGLGVAFSAQSISGAVFTTNQDGSFVNGNVYDSADQPHLNGGPRANAKCSSAGLPDGDYYFQVTDPSGDVLLSSDGLEDRRVTVVGGHIVAASGSHGTGFGRCNDVTVQLAPFDASPSEGGVYKVWMTPVNQFDPSGNGSFGFLPKWSKTDNFKVQAPEDDPVGDSDGDGVPDDVDPCPTNPDLTCYGN